MTWQEFYNRYEWDVSNDGLGEGAFGKVVKAYDNILDSWKAIKIAQVKTISGKEFSLLNEYNAIASLPPHKNIANYESVHRFKGRSGVFDYAIMQFYEEGNLKQLLYSKPLTDHQKKDIILGLVNGVHFLHTNKVIHRDLKPSNILISRKGENCIPKIADFGLSKSVLMDQGTRLTNSFGGGTLDYSSPEQLTGKKLKLNSDLWSLGVIIYEIFLENTPFDAKDSNVSGAMLQGYVMNNIVNAEIPHDIVKIEEPYRSIIKECLVKEPSKRIANSQLVVSKFAGKSNTTTGQRIATPEKSVAFDKNKTRIKGLTEIERWESDNSNPSKNSQAKKEAIAEDHDKKRKAQEQARVDAEKAKEELRRKQISAQLKAEQLRAERKRAEDLKAQQAGVENRRKNNERIEKAKREAELRRQDGEKNRPIVQEDEIATEEVGKNRKAVPVIPPTRIANTLETPKSKKWMIPVVVLFAIVLTAGVGFIFFSNNSIEPEQKLPNRMTLVEISESKDVLRLQTFIDQHPDDLNVGIAEERIKTIRNEKDFNAFQDAKETGSVEAFKSYKLEFPNGLYVLKADEEITNLTKALNEEEAYNLIKENPSSIEISNFKTRFPKSENINELDNIMTDISRKEEKRIWDSVAKTQDIEAIKMYLIQNPNSTFKSKANDLIEEIKYKKDHQEWMAVKKSGDTNAIGKYAQSGKRFSHEAQKLMERKRETEETQKEPLPKEKTEKPDKIESTTTQTETNVEEKETEKSPTEKEETITSPSEIVDIPETPDTKSEEVYPLPELISNLIKDDVLIRGGTFILGCNDCEKDEGPEVELKIAKFYMSSHEVTQAEYKRIMGTNPSVFAGCSSCPVDNVSWHDAMTFIEKLNNIPGNQYRFRLPTEAEWEYAAMAGSQKDYAGSDDIKRVAIFGSSKNGTSKVKSKHPNAFGMYDMSGNVAEWCQDWYQKGAYEDGGTVPTSGSTKVVRGGSWSDKARNCRVKARQFEDPERRSSKIGFRLVREKK